MSAVVPDKISPQEGWRLWGVGAGLLRSLHKDELWHPQVAVRASCREPRTFELPRVTSVHGDRVEPLSAVCRRLWM